MSENQKYPHLCYEEHGPHRVGKSIASIFTIILPITLNVDWENLAITCNTNIEQNLHNCVKPFAYDKAKIINSNSNSNKLVVPAGLEVSKSDLTPSDMSLFSCQDSTSRDSNNSLTSNNEESRIKMTLQMTFPILFSGIGMVSAGILLDYVSTMKVFTEIKDMLTVVTPLLGLKGNLEMTLASRLSTHSNLGDMDTWSQKLAVCVPNLCLDQVQSIVAGFVSAFLAITLGITLTHGNFNYEHSLVLVSTCCTTASLVSLVIGTFMCFIIIIAKKFNFNPDNFSTVFAGMLGDCVTLTLLALIGYVIFEYYRVHWWIPYLALGINVLLLLPICGIVAYKHKCTKGILRTGWISVVIAVFVSSGGGLILEKYEAKHESLTFYQPLINGIGGSLVSILASRIATQLKRDCDKGVLQGSASVFLTPLKAFFGKDEHVFATRILLLLVFPFQIMFPSFAHLIESKAEYSVSFICLFVLATLIQVTILLYLTRILTNLLWRIKSDPDNSISYLTALGDLLGSSLLLAVFEILVSIHS